MKIWPHRVLILFWKESLMHFFYSTRTDMEPFECHFNISAKFPLVVVSIISLPLAVSVWHSAATLSVRAPLSPRRYRPDIPWTQSQHPYYFVFLTFPFSPSRFFFPQRDCVTQSSFTVIDAAASFSSADINAAAGFYMCIRCCDIYSVSF